MPNWTDIELEYILRIDYDIKQCKKLSSLIYNTTGKIIPIPTNVTLKSLAEKYGVNYGTLKNHSSKDKWKHKRREYLIKYNKRLQEKIRERLNRDLDI